jgi:hypothetical protein
MIYKMKYERTVLVVLGSETDGIDVKWRKSEPLIEETSFSSAFLRLRLRLDDPDSNLSPFAADMTRRDTVLIYA